MTLAPGPARIRPEGRRPRRILARIDAGARSLQALFPAYVLRRGPRAGPPDTGAPGRREVKFSGSRLARPTDRSTRNHLAYIGRGGVEPDGTAGRIYDARDVLGGEGVEAFAERARGDPGQVRIALAPRDGHEFPNLRDFTRNLMEKVAEREGGPLDWVAADHFDTGALHVHIVLREVDAEGRPMPPARNAFFLDTRERARDLLTRELGPAPDPSEAARLLEPTKELGVGALDPVIARGVRDGVFDARARPDTPNARLRRARVIDRLRTLSRMGLAYETAPLRWRVAPALIPALGAMEARLRAYGILDRHLADARLGRGPLQRMVFDPASAPRRFVGRLVGWGGRGAFGGSPYVVADGVGGRACYAEVRALPDRPVRGAVVALERNPMGGTDADRPDAGVDFPGWEDGSPVAALGGGPPGPAHAAAPARMEMLARAPPARQVDAPGRTWLDLELERGGPEGLLPSGFGREVARALEARAARLRARRPGREREDGRGRDIG